MSDAKFLSGALILAALFTTPALAVGSDVAHYSNFEASPSAYGITSAIIKKGLTYRYPHSGRAPFEWCVPPIERLTKAKRWTVVTIGSSCDVHRTAGKEPYRNNCQREPSATDRSQHLEGECP